VKQLACLVALSAIALVPTLQGLPAQALTMKLIVASNGVDTGTCGPPATPCRSIMQAMTNATPGDTIVVGPGIYGDLNADGTIGNSPGEEVPSGNAMINVTKTLTIMSRDGAGSTALDEAPNVFAGPGGSVDDVVAINASGVVFGKPNHGFRLRNGHLDGLLIQSGSAKVAGNVAESNGNAGFEVASGVSGVMLTGNAATVNFGSGFFDDATGTVLMKNLARDNAVGLVLDGSAAVVTKNVVTDNRFGVFINATAPGTSSPVATFSHNAMTGNAGEGVRVAMAGNFTQDVSVTLDHNDYFGNGTNLDPNCGVFTTVDDSNATPHTLNVTSTKDFWGAPFGPGPDPADDAGAMAGCEVPTAGNINLTLVTVSATEVKVPPPAIK
jgi:hypothetical protein